MHIVECPERFMQGTDLGGIDDIGGQTNWAPKIGKGTGTNYFTCDMDTIPRRLHDDLVRESQECEDAIVSIQLIYYT